MIEQTDITANGLRFSVRSCGQGPLVLCLHGFPDSADTWDELLPVIADAGYRAVAPFLRGYAPSAVPEDGDYAQSTLGLDVIALADALGAQKFSIVGHDWGALIAYSAAAYAPDRVLGICTAAVPPMRQFLLNTRPAQVKRSWYIAFFQIPWLPERMLGKNDCRLVESLWQAWSPDWEYTPADIASVKSILSQPQNCKAALGYYRALPTTLLNPRRVREMRKIYGKLHVPALVIRGERDGCIGLDSFAGTQQRFTKSCELHTMAAGHFMHREQPTEFGQKVLGFLEEINIQRLS